jgi:hypothetical protein
VDLLVEQSKKAIKSVAASTLYRNVRRDAANWPDEQLQDLFRQLVSCVEYTGKPDDVVEELWPAMALLAALCNTLPMFNDICKSPAAQDLTKKSWSS